MRGYRWLFAAVGLVAVTVFFFTSRGAQGVGDGELALARQAAIQGLNETAKRLVADSTSWGENPERYSFQNASLEGVSYSTEVAAPYHPAPDGAECAVDTVDVVSTAALENGEFHRVEATYVRTCGEDIGIRLVSFAER